MKKFSLDKKRLSKVLALTLAVATVVPNVPMQRSDAAASGRAAVTVPDPIATLDFADKDSYTIEKTIAKQLIFDKTTETSVWPMINEKGEEITKDNSSTYHYTAKLTPKRKKAAAVTEVAVQWSGASDAALGIVTGDPIATEAAVVGSLNPEDYEWEEMDLTPEVVQVTGDAVSGAALSLKAGMSVTTQYPNKGKYAVKKDANPGKWSLADYTPTLVAQVQKPASYGGGAQIENPFAAAETKAKLYDASRYNLDNIMNTAQEVVKSTDGAVLGGPEGFLKEKGTAFTAQEIKSGVTISFWGKVPEDPKTQAPQESSFIEFYNNESLVYQSDDMAKTWAANLYDKNKDDLKSDDPDSLFYRGEVAVGEIYMVGAYELQSNASKNQAYKPRTGKDIEVVDSSDWSATMKAIKAKEGQKIAYIVNNGPFMYMDGSLADYYADLDTGIQDVVLTRGTNDDHSVKVLLAYGLITEKDFIAVYGKGDGRNGLLVTTDKTTTDEDGNTVPLYLLLRESTDIWGSFYDESESGKPHNLAEANTQYGPFRPGVDAPEIEGTDKTQMSKMLRVGKGVTGYLALVTNAADFNRDWGTTGKGINTNHNEAGLLKGFQVSNEAKLNYTDVVPDTEWHYYTYTITDEWFQMYIDGEACDPVSAVIGNKFNLGSGMYAPNGTAYRNDKNIGDIFRLYSYDKTASSYGWAKCAWGFGYPFGDTVMKFITDPNTKLYVGGKTQVTAEGAMVANLSFYDESLTAEQVEKVYADATGKEIEEGVDVLLGDVNNDEVIDAKDALEILKEDVGLEHAGTFIIEVADVNKDEAVDSKDALDILKHDVALELLPEEYITVVLEEAPAE